MMMMMMMMTMIIYDVGLGSACDVKAHYRLIASKEHDLVSHLFFKCNDF